MKKLSVVLIVYAMLLTGCVSTEQAIKQELDPWLGRYQNELYLKWGPPTQITEDGKDGKILIYEYDVTMGQQAGTVKAQGNTVYYTNPQTLGYRKTRMFFVNNQGMIYAYRFKGE